MPFVPIKRDVIRLGHFVKIEGSWFSHPFPTNSFKIKTYEELNTLRELTNVQLFFDPDRSDLESPSGEPPVSPLTGTLEVRESAGHSDFSVGPASFPSPEVMAVDESFPVEEDESPAPDPISRKVAQHQAFQAYQDELQHVNQQFQEVIKEGKQMIQDVVSGRPRGVRTAQKIIDNLLDILGQHQQSRALLNLMGSDDQHEEFFLHALNVCSLSLLIAHELDLKREEKEKLALGALFHDIGELKFPAEKLLLRGSMSPKERKLFLSTHPKHGVELVQKLPLFPYEALEIIQQHHERLNGSGYPNGKKDNQLCHLAKIVMVADEYDELCHHQDPNRAMIPSDALSYLYVKCRQTLWQDAVVALIRQLGVYPPGSLVQLTNKKIGIVTSVNFEQRLRPVILVHDEHGASGEPIVLNLGEEDESLSILSAIRPADLAPRIRECLNPRKIISYFPSHNFMETNKESALQGS